MNVNPASVSLNTNLGFSATADKVEKKENTAIAAVKFEDVQDKAELSTTPQKKAKKGGFNPIQGFKNFMSGCKKLWIGVCEYTNATVVGGIKGVITGGIAFAGLAGLQAAKNNIPKVTEFASNAELKNVAAKAGKFVLNHVPQERKGKAILAAIAGAIPFSVQIFNASLNVSEKTAQVDHRFNTGHRKEG